MLCQNARASPGSQLDGESGENDVFRAFAFDGKLADGLAYLGKVIQKSGNAKYSARKRELSEAAGHKTLRKYAALAARGLT